MSMLNYSMKYGVSEVARILNVERDLIKTWTFIFSVFLSIQANPAKGTPRQFCINDIRVFAYVLLDWEETPDIESIKIGLNSNTHHEDIFNNLMIETTPIFRDASNADGSWGQGAIFGGMSELGDTFALADSYKLAGDKLVDAAIGNEEEFELFCPVIYNYRHATELYLKSTAGKQITTHDLKLLLQGFKISFEVEFNQSLPDWFENIVLAFNDFDPSGTTFRYGGTVPGDEFFVDLNHLKTKMSWLANSFQRIRENRRSNSNY